MLFHQIVSTNTDFLQKRPKNITDQINIFLELHLIRLDQDSQVDTYSYGTHNNLQSLQIGTVSTKGPQLSDLFLPRSWLGHNSNKYLFRSEIDYIILDKIRLELHLIRLDQDCQFDTDSYGTHNNFQTLQIETPSHVPWKLIAF